MALAFLPDRRALFLWGEENPWLAAVAARGEPATIDLAGLGRKRRVAGTVLALLDSVAALAAVPAAEVPALSGSIAVWSLASKLALALVSRERVVPTVGFEGERVVARWAAALADGEDAAQVRALARSMPPAAHAVPVPGGAAREVWAPEALLRAFLDATVDALVRGAAGGPEERPSPRSRRRVKPHDDDFAPWEDRWESALSGSDPAFEVAGFAERTLIDDLAAWSAPALGATDRLRACFRLELPDGGREEFALRFLLQAPDDPSLLVEAGEIWRTDGRRLASLGRAFRNPQESLLEGLGRAARLFSPIAGALAQSRPEGLALDAAGAWWFLCEVAPALAEAGFRVIVPGELTAAGQRRLRLRMRVSGGTGTAGAVAGAAGLGMDELLAFTWEAAIGDETLTARELRALARHKAPLVRHRGQWVAVDPGELAEMGRRLAEREGRVGAREALAAALSGEARVGGRPVAVAAGGAFAELLSRLRDGAREPLAPPPGFQGSLRPYQARGLAWLESMAGLGLGACLADDMGLGKTVQLLAFLLRRSAGADRRPALLVAPTSVLGNWEREAARFAPALQVVRHYGPDRAREVEAIPHEAGVLVVTSYGLLRRDAALLSTIEWSTVALDEAQSIKNAASATAKAARALTAAHRFALTGTPVENRLAELWSILEFANPGLLGGLASFRHELAVPIERYGDEAAAGRLRRMVGPFVLRRLKSDPAIVPVVK